LRLQSLRVFSLAAEAWAAERAFAGASRRQSTAPIA
jgi:hypothetical protein